MYFFTISGVIAIRFSIFLFSGDGFRVYFLFLIVHFLFIVIIMRRATSYTTSALLAVVSPATNFADMTHLAPRVTPAYCICVRQRTPTWPRATHTQSASCRQCGLV